MCSEVSLGFQRSFSMLVCRRNLALAVSRGHDKCVPTSKSDLPTWAHANSTIKESVEHLIARNVLISTLGSATMSNYISNLTPIRTATIVAGFSTTLFTLGNVTSAYLGVVPALLQPDIKLAEKQKADLWLFFYRRAMIFPASTAIASLSFGTVAYVTSISAVRNVAIVGALCSFAIVPFTRSFMIPINNQLTAISQGDSAKEPYTGKLVQKWADLHLVRMVVGAVAWGCAIYLREVV